MSIKTEIATIAVVHKDTDEVIGEALDLSIDGSHFIIAKDAKIAEIAATLQGGMSVAVDSNAATAAIGAVTAFIAAIALDSDLPISHPVVSLCIKIMEYSPGKDLLNEIKK